MKKSNKLFGWITIIFLVIFIWSINTKFQNYVTIAGLIYFVYVISKFSKIKLWDKILVNIIGGSIAGFLVYSYTKEKPIGLNELVSFIVVIASFIMLYFVYYGKVQKNN